MVPPVTRNRTILNLLVKATAINSVDHSDTTAHGGNSSENGESEEEGDGGDRRQRSRYALEWALQNLHESVANNELLVFTVQPLSDYTYLHASAYGAAPPELIRNIQENQKKVALSLLDQAKDLCNKYGITAETVTEVGDPKELICEAVEKFKIQLLVLGSHSRGALQRAFLGSVSNYCVQNVKCPVLVVKKTG